MTKSELVAKLQGIHPSQCRTRIVYHIIQILNIYFSDEHIAEYEQPGCILLVLPKHVARAIEIMAKSSNPNIVAIRMACLAEADKRTLATSITDICVPCSTADISGIELGMIISQELPRLLIHTDYAWLETSLYAYFEAQKIVILQQIDTFDYAIYQRGLCAIIDRHPQRGMSGVFGTTTLESSVSAGRIVFTLTRRSKNETVFRGITGTVTGRTPYKEWKISFTGVSGMNREPNFGIQSAQADLATIISMFGDIITHWPQHRSDQNRRYIPDAGLTLMSR